MGEYNMRLGQRSFLHNSVTSAKCDCVKNEAVVVSDQLVTTGELGGSKARYSAEIK